MDDKYVSRRFSWVLVSFDTISELFIRTTSANILDSIRDILLILYEMFLNLDNFLLCSGGYLEIFSF